MIRFEIHATNLTSKILYPTKEQNIFELKKICNFMKRLKKIIQIQNKNNF